MPVVIFTIVAAITVWVGMALWQGRILIRQSAEHRRCPDCDEPLGPAVPRPHQAARSYEVQHCGSCHTVVTSVHGSRSQFAYCPSCRQLALRLATGSAAPLVIGATPLIEVDELCQICGYQGVHELDGRDAVGDRPPDNVIPFRRQK